MNMGLNEYQSSALVYLLLLGETKATTLSKTSKVPSARIYGVLDQLAKMGLVSVRPGRPVLYSPRPPEDIASSLVSLSMSGLKQKLRTFPQSFPLSPEHSRDRLFEAVSQFITNISREAPSLVILDDLQWTDRSSLLLLHYLAHDVYKESLLLLGAYRHTHVDKKHP